MAENEMTFRIENNPQGLFVTCQRPIVIRIKHTSGSTPAYFKGVLLLESSAGSGNYFDTGVVMNGYSENDDGFFSFNVAEYCRQYFLEEEAYYSANWCGNFDRMLSRAFILRVFPVMFNTSGGLIENPDNSKESNPFIVVPNNTMATESTSSENDWIRQDKFVLNGNNSSGLAWPGSSWNRLMTNMPDNNVIDIDNGFYYYFPYLHRGVTGREAKMHIQNQAGITLTIPMLGAGPTTTKFQHASLHPALLEFLLAVTIGTWQDHLVDINGDLTSNTMKITMKFYNSSTGAFIRSGPSKRYKLQSGVGSCDGAVTFLFRNMRGGFDFFTATGTQKKEVQLSGTEFDRHTTFARQDRDLGLLRGQHNITNLWNTRKEMHTVFSQPVSTQQADWLEELIVSPQVWIIKDIKDYYGNSSFLNPAPTKGLQAINIIKSTYKLHTTEKGVHFIEFKYTPSENTSIQKM